MKLDGFVVVMKNKEIHVFKEREDYLEFVKGREDIAWLFAHPKAFYDKFMEVVECEDALDWLDEVDGDVFDEVIKSMEYHQDAKLCLLTAYREMSENKRE